MLKNVHSVAKELLNITCEQSDQSLKQFNSRKTTASTEYKHSARFSICICRFPSFSFPFAMVLLELVPAITYCFETNYLLQIILHFILSFYIIYIMIKFHTKYKQATTKTTTYGHGHAKATFVPVPIPTTHLSVPLGIYKTRTQASKLREQTM